MINCVDWVDKRELTAPKTKNAVECLVVICFFKWKTEIIQLLTSNLTLHIMQKYSTKIETYIYVNIMNDTTMKMNVKERSGVQIKETMLDRTCRT